MAQMHILSLDVTMTLLLNPVLANTVSFKSALFCCGRLLHKLFRTQAFWEKAVHKNCSGLNSGKNWASVPDRHALYLKISFITLFLWGKHFSSKETKMRCKKQEERFWHKWKGEEEDFFQVKLTHWRRKKEQRESPFWLQVVRRQRDQVARLFIQFWPIFGNYFIPNNIKIAMVGSNFWSILNEPSKIAKGF